MANPHRRRLSFTLVAIVLTLIAVAPSDASTFSPGDGLIGSVSAGRGWFTGKYGTYLEGAGAFGADLSHPLPFAALPLLFECGFAALNGSMKESGSSRFVVYSLHAGVLGYYPLHRRLYPFAGIVIQESYMKLTASRIDESERAFKPGAGVRAGFFLPITSSIGLRAFFDYRYTPLSHDSLESRTLGIAATARLPFGDMAWARSGRDSPAYDTMRSKERAEFLVSRGIERLEKGDADGAEESFRQAVDIDPDNRKAASMLAEIDAARAAYALAKSLIKEMRYYEAIPQLERSLSLNADPGRELSEIRSMLAADLPALEKSGIAAYETHRYDECIAIMKRIRLIDPNNRTVQLYLPRAEGRQRAIERLR